MTDSFALLNESRLPWLDLEALKQKFLELSTEVHPDRVHSSPVEVRERATVIYSDLNAAYNTLREPRERLLHLLELEAGAKPRDVQRIPPGTMDLFVQVGEHCRDVDAFLASRANVTSPLLKVQVFQQAMEWTDKLQALRRTVDATRNELMMELKQMNEVWHAAPSPGAPGRTSALPLERLEQIYRVLSYVARWSEQIQERTIQLTAGSF